MPGRKNFERRVRQKSQEYADLYGLAHGPLQYISRPGDGQVRYVFEGKTCLGGAEALAYINGLLDEAQASKAREMAKSDG